MVHVLTMGGEVAWEASTIFSVQSVCQGRWMGHRWCTCQVTSVIPEGR